MLIIVTLRNLLYHPPSPFVSLTIILYLILSSSYAMLFVAFILVTLSSMIPVLRKSLVLLFSPPPDSPLPFTTPESPVTFDTLPTFSSSSSCTSYYTYSNSFSPFSSSSSLFSLTFQYLPSFSCPASPVALPLFYSLLPSRPPPHLSSLSATNILEA